MKTIVHTVKYKSKGYKLTSFVTFAIGTATLLYSLYSQTELMYLFFSGAIILVGGLQLVILLKEKIKYDNLCMPTELVLEDDIITALYLSREFEVVKFRVRDILEISKFTKTDVNFTINNETLKNIECSFSPIEFSNLKRHLRPLLSAELKEKLSGGVNVDAFENL